MFERLEQIEARYEELTQALASPEVINDSAKYQKTAKAHSELVPVVEKFREFKDLKRGIEESKALVAGEDDAEMRAYAQEELSNLEQRLARVEEELEGRGALYLRVGRGRAERSDCPHRRPESLLTVEI